MKSFITNISIISVILITAILFTTCKKYPENNLWFKNPYSISVISGYITQYNVNGIDSLSLLNSYYATYTAGISPPYQPYTNPNKNIATELFKSILTKNIGDINSNCGTGTYLWDRKKKKINIFFKADNPIYYKKNIFINNEKIDWDIIYLDKNSKKSKIKTTYNGNTYEITFQN
jgi:hypothetical protein